MNKHGKKGNFTAKTVYNRKIGKTFYKIGLEFCGKGAEAFGSTKAGQFAQVDLCGTGLPKQDAIPEALNEGSSRKIFLRRPFSFSKIEKAGGKVIIEILYCVVGPASLRMTTLKEGDDISVAGPLGNGFWVPEDIKT